MKSLLIIFALLVSYHSFAKSQAFSYKEIVTVKKVVMADDILIKDLSNLYSDIWFEDRMIASKSESHASKKNWSDKLRTRLKESNGKFINFL